MTKLNRIGFFQELRYGEKDGPSIKIKLSQSWMSKKELVVKYLRKGKVFIISPGISKDFFDESKIIGAGPNILTDGLYAWPSDLSYYVAEYDVNLPLDFLEYIQSCNWEMNTEKIDTEQLEI